MEDGSVSPAMSGAGEPGYVVVARRDEVPPGTLKRVAYGDQAVVLANVNGQFYALEDECLHYGVPLSEGFLRDSTVICMWHAWRYDLPSGRLVNPPSTRLCLGRYPVRVDGDTIAIGPRAPAPGAPPAAST
ncbi:MAG TPA: Rieske (2Fe-2S) protein [Chloroflexota bacterium]|nr:Rieske (2Fe-2S) protein [Chloroflexota bacterium]